MVYEDIVKIRELIYSMFPNIANLHINHLIHKKELTTGEITIHLLNGQIKICLISYIPETDKFELKEK